MLCTDLHTHINTTRRNQPGDRAKALELILPLVESGGKVASDIYCLCGRIYKDMFISSSFSDVQSREQACYWCASLSSLYCLAFPFLFFPTLQSSPNCQSANVIRHGDSSSVSSFASGTGKPLRRSRRFTRASTVSSSWWQRARNLKHQLSCARSVRHTFTLHFMAISDVL